MIRMPYTAVDSSELNKLLKNWLFLFTLATAFLLLQSQLLFAQDPSSKEAMTVGYYNMNLEVVGLGLKEGQYSLNPVRFDFESKEDPNRLGALQNDPPGKDDGVAALPVMYSGDGGRGGPSGPRGGGGHKGVGGPGSNPLSPYGNPPKQNLEDGGDGSVGLANNELDNYVQIAEASTPGYSFPEPQGGTNSLQGGLNTTNDILSVANNRDNTTKALVLSNSFNEQVQEQVQVQQVGLGGEQFALE